MFEVLSEGVLEDEREREVSRRQPKRVFQARAGRRSTDVVVLEAMRKHDGLPYGKGVALERDGGREAHRAGKRVI